MLSNLKILRAKKGISQQTLGDEIGVSQQSINKYENHNIEPDITTLIAIAEYFNTTIDFIVGRTNIPFPFEQIKSVKVSREEANLIKLYRGLPDQQKEAILTMLQSYYV